MSLLTTRKYRLTKKGIVRNMFCHIKQRCFKYGRDLEFSSEELLSWCLKQNRFHELFNQWVIGNYAKKLKPSIDRIDPLKGYVFDNIQLLSYQENRNKGDKEKEILWGKPILQFDKARQFIKRFPSIKQAVKETGLNQGLISAVLLGKRNHTGGYVFEYDNPHLLNATGQRQPVINMQDPREGQPEGQEEATQQPVTQPETPPAQGQEG